jgi:Domain of unknown function (DUF4388)
VSLAGRLEEIELAELLHFLSLNNRTGKVLMSRRDSHGLIVLRLGRIVYAASSSIRESFGNILVCRGLVSPEVLARALERQHLGLEGRRLGDLLVEDGSISQDQLQDALRQQTGLVVQELCRWRSGYFKFEVGPVASSGEIGVDAEDLVVTDGVATDQVLLEAMTRLDEAAPAPEPPSTARAIAGTAFAPSLRGEVTLGLLRQARAVVERGLLMVVRGDEAQGASQLGLAGSDPDATARQVRLSLAESGVVADAVNRDESWTGAVPSGHANDRLLELLGGVRPNAALVVPMRLREGAGLVFYGDDGGELRPLGDVAELEWALVEAGLAMERDLLDQRLADFERARGYRP